MNPDLSVILVSWNTRGLLAAALEALPEAAAGLRWEAIVVDNASADGSADLVATDFPEARLIRNNTNGGFARACNQGLAVAAGNGMLLLNSDTVPPPGALRGLVDFLREHPDAGACGPRLVGPDGRPQPFAFGQDPTLRHLVKRGLWRLLFGRPLHDWAATEARRVDWVSGACLLARREALEQVGGLDEGFFLYFEDTDWCLRLRQAGWAVYHEPGVVVTHVGGGSTAQDLQARRIYYRSLERFHAKHYGALSRVLLKAMLAPYRLIARGARFGS